MERATDGNFTPLIRVTKRNGMLQDLKIDEIREIVTDCCRGFISEADIETLIGEAVDNLYDGIATSEINRAVTMALRGRIEQDPIYSELATRLLFNDLYKDVLKTNEFDGDFHSFYRAQFAPMIALGVEIGKLDPKLAEYDLDMLSAALVPDRDNLFQYLGGHTLVDRYFLRTDDRDILEVPQFFWMRIAMGLALTEVDRESRAIEFYNAISQLLYVPSTPTLFHAGTAHAQMSSCYLTTIDDDLDHIFKCLGDNARLSKWSGGIGNDWTNIRGTGGLIHSTNIDSQGLIPFLKITDSVTAAIARSGKRRGAACAYLETWHYDIEDFLELRKNTGDERRRTHNMNTANWIPDLFMQRVRDDGEWTLFSPDETPDLHDLYGAAFKVAYEEYEEIAKAGGIKVYRVMRARDLWRKMITMLYETGHPWIVWKDPANVRSPQDHAGVVHSSNLCTEITLNTSRSETAVCNLGSVNLARHVTPEGRIDWKRLRETVTLAVRMLDNVIDVNFYPTGEARNANLRHRPVGLGMMGFQDALFLLDLAFESDAAVELSDELQEFISYYAILASSRLAMEKGVYKSYNGSKWSRGIMPLDTLAMLEAERGEAIPVNRKARLDWDYIRVHVRKNGMRNSNLLALAPTATISNIAGVFISIEPAFKNLYAKSNVSGEFVIVNRYLVADLKEIGLWTPWMLEKIKYHDGSIQGIEEIPQVLRSKYKEAFEVDPIWIIRHASVRGKWIDQSQSINFFTKSQSGPMISRMYQAAWEYGLKTTYYLRTQGASSVEKSTVKRQPRREPTIQGTGEFKILPGLGEPMETALEKMQEENLLRVALAPPSIMAAAGEARRVSTLACGIDNPDCESCQ